MLPLPRAAIFGASAATRKYADRTLAAKSRSKVATSSSAVGPNQENPALLTRTSTGPACPARSSSSAGLQLRGLFTEDGTPLHNYASYLGLADLAAAAVRADRQIEGRDVIEHALSHLNGMASPRLEQLIGRARGILADPASAEAHFGKALSDPAGARPVNAMPYGS